MNLSFKEKADAVKSKFACFSSSEEKYNALMDMGRRLPPLAAQYKTPERLVRGCQSALYLRSYLHEGKIFFEAAADALISAGLAALLLSVYSGETPETVLKTPPDFLTATGIAQSLSLNRSNGLAHIHLRMKQEALKYLLQPA